jgi:hypothetical protein
VNDDYYDGGYWGDELSIAVDSNGNGVIDASDYETYIIGEDYYTPTCPTFDVIHHSCIGPIYNTSKCNANYMDGVGWTYGINIIKPLGGWGDAVHMIYRDADPKLYEVGDSIYDISKSYIVTVYFML